MSTQQSKKFNLTPMQRKVFDFIVKYMNEHEGIAPKYEDIQKGLNIKAKSNVSRHVQNLKARGWIDYIPNHAQSIIIL